MLMAFLFLGPIIVIAAFVVYDTLRGRGEFSVNIARAPCPKCAFKVSQKEIRWSFFTPRPDPACPVCGSPPEAQNIVEKSRLISDDALKPVKTIPSAIIPLPFDGDGKSPVERMMDEK